ncbi:MAG: biosynthetic-type acetolactate synthase large subunit [Candidatus Hydrogenedentes bacterium]|nr:biosynthetic-type acetolactate synthase large subunit [Candidatus Hydrogenedentota bacterium]
MTGAEMVIQVLADEGIDAIFGYSGGAILPTYDAVFRWNESHPEQEIKLIVPANEQGAGFMAAGYSRVTGKVGITLVTSGPGATNTVTPVRDAMADSIPMIVICGQVPRAAVGTDAFQEAPVFNIMSACAKHVFLVKNPDELEATVRTAFHIARSGRPGPVVIDIPKDVQNWEGAFTGSGLLTMVGYQRRLDGLENSRLPQEKAESFLRMLKASHRPLIYAGGGVVNSNASQELTAFAHKYQIPVVTTLMGIGSIDTTDPLCLHMLGMHGTAYANYAVEDCDFLIAVGSRFDDRVAGKPKEFAARAKIAHIDIDAAEIGKVKAVEWHHVGDAGVVLRELMTACGELENKHQHWLDYVAELKQKHHMAWNTDTPLIQPQEVLALINKITKGDAIITTGVGQHQMFAAQYFDFKEPRTWLTSGSMGTMGYGLPAAIGAQVGAPGKIVIDVDGDGSIRMNIGEMETCTNYDIPVKVLLLNNKGDGMVVQWQTLYFGSRFSGTDKTLHQKDFVAAAKADGFKYAERVEAKADLEKKIADFIAFEGPAFLEVMTDNTAFVYPMVGPGLAYKDMLTGPHITGREEDPFAKLDAADAF